VKLSVAFLTLVAVSSAAEVRVVDFGAKGDGVTVDTSAIQKAIDQATLGGSTVVFKPGVYLTGALFLKSGMEIRIDEGVVLRGVEDLAAYPEMPTRVAGIEMTWPSALLNIYEQSNVRIYGKGIIDGQGKYWWDRYWALRKQYEPKGLRWASDYDAKRVRLIQIYKSSKVVLQGLTLQRSGFWTVHLCYSRSITVEDITIQNNIGGRGPSTDGIDVDSSSDVMISRCDISCNDDALCMKAGRDADGLRVNRPTENVIVNDCTVRQGAAGFTIGSETSGGIRNIKVSGLHVLHDVPKGICFKSAKVRGGTVENIDISNVAMQGVAVPVSITLNWNPSYSYAQIPPESKNVPDYWRKLAEPVPPEKGMPHFRNARISGIQATGAKRAFEVNAYPSAPVENFRFDHMGIEAVSAGTIEGVVNWTFADTVLKIQDRSKVTVKNSRDVKGLPDLETSEKP
jgi:polygalacturonase